MRSLGRIRLFLLIVMGAAIAGASLSGSASAWELVAGPPRQAVVSWSLDHPPGDEGRYTVTFDVVTGFCTGEPPPVAGPATIVERPVSNAHPRPTAIITAREIRPAPIEVSGAVKPDEPTLFCGGIGSGFEKRVRLKRPVDGMLFYDGSFDPPKLVKPAHTG